MEIKRKDDLAAESSRSGKAEYTGMSLRHEKVANESLPKINIFFAPGNEERAWQISYGIEEEGLPRLGIESSEPFAEALEDTRKKGLGVAIGVDEKCAQIFCRQFKKNEPFMSCRQAGIEINRQNQRDADEQDQRDAEKDILRTIGKNASRILKHKPFIIDEQ